MLQTYTYDKKIDKFPLHIVKNFLGLVIYNNLSWDCHIDQMIPKLNNASYIIISWKLLLCFESLKIVYFSTVHSVISYGVTFCSISTRSKIIFKIQKRIIRIVMNSDSKTSWCDLF